MLCGVAMFAGCCLLFDVRCALFVVVRCLMRSGCCLLFVLCCGLLVDLCWLCVVCFYVCCFLLLRVVCCLMFGV